MTQYLQAFREETDIISKEELISSLFPILYPAEKLPDTCVKAAVKGMEDIAIAFLINRQNGYGTLFSKTEMEMYGITMQEIFDHANHTNYGFKLASLSAMLGHPDDTINNIFYVLTNESGYFGAAAITNPVVLHRLRENFGCSLYILPSSVHEVLLLPVGVFPKADPRELAAMVKEINRAEVEPKDRLSDRVYFFDYEQDCIRTVA
ncbi:DUF5688 family protein [Roseburia hominis]